MVTIYSKRVGNILLAVALLVAVVFLARYIGIFALAALTVLLFSPVHNWIQKKTGRPGLSVGLTIIAIITTLIVPLSIVIGLSFHEAQRLIDDLKENSPISPESMQSISTSLTQGINSLGVSLSKDEVHDKFVQLLQEAVTGLVGFIFHTTSGIVAAFGDAIIYLMLLATILARKSELIGVYKRLSPLDNAIDEEYLQRIKAMAISMVKGTFFIALVVGTICSLTLWLLGFHYIVFWFMIFTLLSFVPLGAGILFIPLGILLILLGSQAQGVIILLVQFLLLNNVDNVLRPRLAPKESNLPGVLLLVSTFAGVSFFGLIGVVYGPIIMALVYTTIELYLHHREKGLPLKSVTSPT